MRAVLAQGASADRRRSERITRIAPSCGRSHCLRDCYSSPEAQREPAMPVELPPIETTRYAALQAGDESVLEQAFRTTLTCW